MTAALAGEADPDILSKALADELTTAVPGVDPAVVDQLARTRTASLIKGLTRDQKNAVRRLASRAVREGWSEEDTADRLGRIVGLGPRYTNAVENYRRGLIDKGTPRGTARTMASAYAKRLRAVRARTIVRSELARLTAEAKRQTWAEWKKNGVIDQYAVRVWHTHPTEEKCVVCRPMNGQRAAIGRSYSRGKMGPPLHPNCRCWESLERGPDVLMKADAKDGDGDGWIDDGKPTMRPAIVDFGEYLSATWRDHAKQQKMIKAFDSLPDDAKITVYHGTTKEHADLLTSGDMVVADSGDRDKKLASWTAGLYVAPTHDDAEMYGDYVVKFTAQKKDILPSEEAGNVSAGHAFMNTSGGSVVPPGFVITGATVVNVTKLAPDFKYRHLVGG